MLIMPILINFSLSILILPFLLCNALCLCVCVCLLGAGKGAERSDASKIVKVTGAVSGTAKKGQAHHVNLNDIHAF
jgi:hypothetical protein